MQRASTQAFTTITLTQSRFHYAQRSLRNCVHANDISFLCNNSSQSHPACFVSYSAFFILATPVLFFFDLYDLSVSWSNYGLLAELLVNIKLLFLVSFDICAGYIPSPCPSPPYSHLSRYVFYLAISFPFTKFTLYSLKRYLFNF